MDIFQVAKAGRLSGINNMKVNWWLFLRDCELISPCRCFLWILTCIPRHVCLLRTRLESCMTERQSYEEMEMYSFSSFSGELMLMIHNFKWFIYRHCLSHLRIWKHITMVIMHLMVPGFTTLGQLAMPSQKDICTLTGSKMSQVISPSIYFDHCKAQPFPRLWSYH